MATTSFDLPGQVVLLTGGASGIGAGIGAVLAGAGATIVIADIDDGRARQQAAKLIAAGHTADHIRIDLADENSIVDGCRQVVERHGAPWALVNNAGVQDRQMLLDATAAEWDRVLAVNTRGPFLTMREIGRAMVEAKTGGRIVNVSSAAVIGMIIKGHAAYASSKTALLGLARVGALELAEHGITVNTVLPGGVLTPGAMTSKGPSPDGPALRPPPLGMCEPHDIGAMVQFLVSPAARSITNQVFTVDGGWSTT